MSLSTPLPTEYDAGLSKYLAGAPSGDVLALLAEQFWLHARAADATPNAITAAVRNTAPPASNR